MTTKTQQRQQRQDRARALRDVERKKAQRKRSLIISGAVVAVLILVAVIGIAISASKSSSGGGADLGNPKDAVTTGSAVAKSSILIGNANAPVIMDAYEDFTCPICGTFEKGDGATVSQLVNNGSLAVRYHMLSFIDDNNGSTYSHRAAGAFAAADQFAGATKALQLHALLYANQPDETSSTGLTDSKILQLASQVGITSQGFTDAVNNQSYKKWVATVADDGSKAGVTGTPTIYLNGTKIPALSDLANPTTGALDPQILIQKVNAAKGTGTRQ